MRRRDAHQGDVMEVVGGVGTADGIQTNISRKAAQSSEGLEGELLSTPPLKQSNLVLTAW